MVVDAAGGARGDRIERADQARIIAGFFVQAPVETPPPLLQDLDEVVLRPGADEHPPRQPRIVVMMPAYVAGNDGPSGSVDDLVGLDAAGGTASQGLDDIVLMTMSIPFLDLERGIVCMTRAFLITMTAIAPSSLVLYR
jgi:hypothetical protein